MSTNHDPQGIVTPSSFLNRKRGQSNAVQPTAEPTKTESETAIDRDQRVGLVGLMVSDFFVAMQSVSHLDFLPLPHMYACWLNALFL